MNGPPLVITDVTAYLLLSPVAMSMHSEDPGFWKDPDGEQNKHPVSFSVHHLADVGSMHRCVGMIAWQACNGERVGGNEQIDRRTIDVSILIRNSLFPLTYQLNHQQQKESDAMSENERTRYLMQSMRTLSLHVACQ
jgi:hypothetical protein